MVGAAAGAPAGVFDVAGAGEGAGTAVEVCDTDAAATGVSGEGPLYVYGSYELEDRADAWNVLATQTLVRIVTNPNLTNASKAAFACGMLF